MSPASLPLLEAWSGAPATELAAAVGDAVRLGQAIERILVGDGRAVGVRRNGRDTAAAAVVSTAPANLLPDLVEGTDAFERAAATSGV